MNLNRVSSIIPISIYASHSEPPDLRLTARLTVRAANDEHDVVFKGNRFPPLASSARAHMLVSESAAGMVPNVIAMEEFPDGASFLLYEPFEGRTVGGSRAKDLMPETARTMATIQNRVSRNIDNNNPRLPVIGAADIPSLFDSVCKHISLYHEAWTTDEDGKLSKWLEFDSGTILDEMHALRPSILRCAEVVVALNLADSIDHGDLHGGNVVEQDDGTQIIFDWETATFGCPLFSVEKLLVAAWSMDVNSLGTGPWGYVPGTPSQSRVRDAYLCVLETGPVSNTAFASAMCLATIKEMHAEISWANLMGWQDDNPEWTAQLVRRLRYHLLATVA